MAENSENSGVEADGSNIPESFLEPAVSETPDEDSNAPVLQKSAFRERLASAAQLKISDKSLKQPSIEKPLQSSDFKVDVIFNGEIRNIPISRVVNSHLLITGKGFPKYSDKLKDAIKNPGTYNLVDPDLDTMERFLTYVLLVEKEISSSINLAHEDKFLLSEIINELGDETGVSDSNRYANEPIKGFTRALSKAVSDDEYNGDWTHIRDYARGALVYSNVEDVARCIELFKSPKYAKNYNKIYIRDFLTDPSSGEKHPVKYRDVNISIELKSGRVVELQIHLDIIFEAQKSGRTISRDAMSIFSENDIEYLNLHAHNAKLFTTIDENNIIVKTHDIYEIRRAMSNDDSSHSKKIMLKLRQLETAVNEDAWQEYLTKQNNGKH